MKFYCAMVLTGDEKKFKNDAEQATRELFPSSSFFFFERRLFTPRRGWFTGAIFPGYVFFEVEELTPEFFQIIKKIKSFCRILHDNQNPTEISGNDLDELKLFLRNGEMWGVSKVKFLPGQRIKAVSGPLVGFEGNVVRVNRKRRQVTVQSTLTGMSMRFDLKFEEVEEVRTAEQSVEKIKI